MAKDPTFPFYAQDYLIDTMRWTLEMKGLHIDLLAEAWVNGWLANAKPTLSRPLGYPCGLPENYLSIWDNIKHKWYLENDTWKNKKLSDVKEKRLIYKESQSVKGKLGAEKKQANAKPTLSRPLAAAEPMHEVKSSFSHSYSLSDNNITTEAAKIYEILKTGTNGFHDLYLQFRSRQIAIEYEGKEIKNLRALVNKISSSLNLYECKQWLENQGIEAKTLQV